MQQYREVSKIKTTKVLDKDQELELKFKKRKKQQRVSNKRNWIEG